MQNLTEKCSAEAEILRRSIRHHRTRRFPHATRRDTTRHVAFHTRHVATPCWKRRVELTQRVGCGQRSVGSIATCQMSKATCQTCESLDFPNYWNIFLRKVRNLRKIRRENFFYANCVIYAEFDTIFEGRKLRNATAPREFIGWMTGECL